jgi:hypothetical protein
MSRTLRNSRLALYAAAFGALLLGAGASMMAQSIPPGTVLVIRTDRTLESGKVKTGNTWSGTLVAPIYVDDKLVAREGSPVGGIVTEAKSAGRFKGIGGIALEVNSVNAITVSSDIYTSDGEGHTKGNVTRIGGGAAVGAAMGGIFGGGTGAAIGALTGAGGGILGAALSGKKQARIPAESTLSFKVQ